MEFRITLLSGDGVGSEIMDGALVVLNAIAAKFDHTFRFGVQLIGGIAIERTGVPLPQQTIDECRKSDAVLIGAVGADQYIEPNGLNRAEKAFSSLRNTMGLFASVTPVVSYDELRHNSPLKPLSPKKRIDLVVVREMLGGIYFGQRGYRDGSLGQQAFDTESYSIAEVERVANFAIDLAKTRRSRIVSIDNADFLESSRLWRMTVQKLAKAHPSLVVESILAKDFFKYFLSEPDLFDVVLCPNMLGDLITNFAISATGAPQMLPTSNMGYSNCSVFYPAATAHSSVADTDTANPIGMIMSAAIMFSALNYHRETLAIESAVRTILGKGYRTSDIYIGEGKRIGCAKMAELIGLEILNS